MKRILLLTSMCVFAILSSNAKVVTGHCGKYLTDSLYWSFDTATGELTITGNGRMMDYTGESTYNFVLMKNRCDIPWYDDYRHQITSVSLLEGLPNIGSYAFYGCDNLVNISLPESVQSIGKMAFNGTHLSSINIPNSVTQIGESAFGTGAYLPVINNVIYADTYIVGVTDKTLSSYTIQNGTRWIGYKAFQECSNLTAINIPNSILYIEEAAFKNCTNLSTVSLSEGLVSIGDDAFINCVVTNITIPNSVKTIGQGAFRDTQLEIVTIGENAAEIGMLAFACNTLQTVNWNVIRYNDTINTNTGYGTNKVITSYSSLNKGIGGSNPTPFYGSSQTYGNNITSFIFGDQVQYIPKCLCEGLIGLEEVTIPQSIKEINVDAFFGCDNLSSVNWNAIHAKVVKKSNTDALWNSYHALFMGAQHPKLQSIIFGENVEGIPEYLCLSISSLSITLGHKVNSISTFTFKNSGINTINFTGSLQEWCSLNHGYLMVGGSYVGGNSGWTGGNLYIQNVQMDSLIIPQNITKLSNYSFRYCKNIHSVTFEATVPPSIGTEVFDDTIPIYVPYCAYPDYYDSDQWKEYRTRIIETSSFAINLQANDNTLGDIFISGRNCETNKITITAQPAYKCKFIRWSDGNIQQTRNVSLNNDINLIAYFAKIEYYTVKFFDWDNTELSSQQIEEGLSAVAPDMSDRVREGYTFVGWDKDFTNVLSNLDIYAQYESNSEGIEDIQIDKRTPHKEIVNGQIYIIRSDKIYTLTGQEVK